MMSSKPSQADELKAASRPFGVWLLTTCHVMYALAGIFSWSRALYEPIPHGWSPNSTIQAPYVLAVFAALLISACGAWLGNRHARTALLISLIAAIGVSARDVYLVLLEARTQDVSAWHSALLWTAIVGGSLLIWLMINYWYFLKRAKGFYARRTIREGSTSGRGSA